ncbi:S-locus lectin protein kinase family protein [Striga asiatica]|uniref:Receptor-like serine/threonine-protein kinase n=1 Tax=Striga asiatica TaxID=4170 RepID=A0A5A7R6Q5_STRAF|nr:S-locus lectin protein kinase family protein [Striga asiatica]
MDTISTSQFIKDSDVLVSSGQTFELGFFSPGSSTNRYLGIWYRNITVRTPVWVANRDSPVRNTTSGVLTVNPSGQLLILDESNNNNTIWSSNTSRTARNPVVQLLDSGNLVVQEANNNQTENYLWQSFDHPTDTLLPGMSITAGRQLSSWRTNEDPAPGVFTFGFDSSGYPQVVIAGGGAILYRLGPWNGIQFSPRQRPVFEPGPFTSVYYSEEGGDESVVARFTLSPIGVGQRWTWVRGQSQEWVFSYTFPADVCDTYRQCGPHGWCDPGRNPVCACLEKFVPRVEGGWSRSDWSAGCVRRRALNCRDDVFLRYSGIKLPYSRDTWYNGSLGVEECMAVCERNCSCMAYSNMMRNGRSGCMVWFGDLVDVRRIAGAKQVFSYLETSSWPNDTESNGIKRRTIMAALTSLSGIGLLCLCLALFVWKRKKKTRKLRKEGGLEESTEKEFELPIYDLSIVAKSTDDFSNSNKLGEGGFGPVYKGKLENGMEIAVKRLSETSSQGLDEFKNEVICIAKLQHRNLVKLLGCCIQGEEKMLLYEYMPNKSLDLILFGENLLSTYKTKKQLLDWPKRFDIINGISKGLLYLHQDSHLRIIHRDLKASNVLLDNELNPKISDFGMARIFGGNETEAKTKRVVGTYGYMSPEYAGDGLFSLKSDVYSFGVLVLEIVTGQRNRGFQHKDHHHNLLGHAWMLYKEGRPLELIDHDILSTVSLNELLKSIHVALLCVQHCPQDRPCMSSVVLMLGSSGVLPEARQPGFFTERRGFFSEGSTSTNAMGPSNEYTITLLEPR